jgi:hypothetical protein
VADRRGSEPDRRAAVRRRPAESVTGVAGLGGVIAGVIAGNELAAALAAIGFLPTVVTFIVNHGGLVGLKDTILHGR